MQNFAVTISVIIILHVLQIISALNQLPLLEVSLHVKGQWDDGSAREKSVPMRRQGRQIEHHF